MNRSESITKIAGALLLAQKVMGGAVKGASNPFFKSKYSDYGAVLEACKDALNDNGVVILQPHHTNERGTFVETMLVHESGEWVSSETAVVVAKQNDPQAFGSALTYARRYSLQSLVALPSEDDDGNSASGKTETKNTAPAASWRKQSLGAVPPPQSSTTTPSLPATPKTGGLEF